MFSSPALAQKETFKFKPEAKYRLLGLNIDRDAAFSKPEHRDNQQQIWLSLLSTGSVDFAHSFVMEPVIRTKRTRFDETEPELVIDQAYISTNLSDTLEFSAGRRIHYEGSGLFVNPSDLLNERRNLFDPTYERTAYLMTSFTEVYDDHQVTVGFLPQKGGMLRDGSTYFRYGGQLGDVNTIFKYKNEKDTASTFGVSLSRFFGDHLELHTDTRYQTKQRSEVLERERNFSDLKKEDASIYSLIGSRYAFTYEHSFIFEYILNQSGLKKEEFELFYDYIRTAADLEREPDNRILGREYVLVSYYHKEIVPKTSMESAVLLNVQDSSGFASLLLTYHTSSITRLQLRPVTFWGAKNTEFGEMPFPSAVYITVAASI